MKCINKFFIPWVSVSALLLAGGSGSAEQVFIAHCKHGCPVKSSDSLTIPESPVTAEVIVRHLYVAAISSNGLAEWVAYRILPESVGVASLLPRYWQLDELSDRATALESEVGESTRLVQPDLSDSQDSDYRVNEVTLLTDDRGRLTPMTGFAGTPYWDELNYLSNMAPLPAALRTGAWARLDQAVNELAQKGNSYYVISGPVSEAGAEVAEQQSLKGFFKLIAIDNRLAAFEFPVDTAPQDSYCNFTIAYEDIVASSGFNFFPTATDRFVEDLYRDLGCTY